jgi:hypothetical protein
MKLRSFSFVAFAALFACSGSVDLGPAPSPPASGTVPPRDPPEAVDPPGPTGRPPVPCKEDGRPVATRPLSGVVRGKSFTLMASTGQLFNASGPDTSTELIFAATSQHACKTDSVVPIPMGVHVTVHLPQHLVKAGTSVTLGPFGSEPEVGLQESVEAGSADGVISECGRVEVQEVDTDASTGKVTRVKLGLRAVDVYGDAVEGVADVTYCP